MSSYTQRVGEKAQQIRLARVLLAVFAAPLYVLGWLAGVLVVALLWVFAAVVVGFGDARSRAAGRSD